MAGHDKTAGDVNTGGVHGSLYDASRDDQHFFASTAFAWAVSKDPASAISKAKRLTFGSKTDKTTHVILFYVPRSIDAEYTITWFAPQGVDAVKVYEGKA